MGKLSKEQELKKLITTNSKDAKLCEKLLRDYKNEVKGELIFPCNTKDVVFEYETKLSKFFVGEDNSVLVKTHSGFNVQIPSQNARMLVVILEKIKNKDFEEGRDEIFYLNLLDTLEVNILSPQYFITDLMMANTNQYSILNQLNLFTTIYSKIDLKNEDFELLSKSIVDIIKDFAENYKNEPLQEENEEDVKEFKEAVVGLENLKEMVKNEQD